jgi:putative hydrolase of the HAD superfamily
LRAAERISHFCDKTPEQIFDLFFESEVTILFEEGKLSPQEFFKRVKEMLGLRLEFESFVPIWNDIFSLSITNRAVYSLVNRLRHDYQVVLLSNINALHYEYLRQRFPVFGVFHRVFKSFEMGLIKPDPAIYKKVLEELNAQAGDVFYADDRMELVESAKALGINSFQFRGIGQLKKDLESVGVKID